MPAFNGILGSSHVTPELSFGEQCEVAIEASQFSAGKKLNRQDKQTHRREAEVIRLAQKRQVRAQKTGQRIVTKAVESRDAGGDMMHELNTTHKAIWYYDLASRSYEHQKDPLLGLESQRQALADLNEGASGTGYVIAGFELRAQPAYEGPDIVFAQFHVEPVTPAQLI
ncbi:MAG: hypothetical protein AAB462_02245 [Patescibacteria group bacterium]